MPAILLYAAGWGDRILDLSDFPMQPIKCLNQAIKPFKDCAELVDQVLRAFAFDIYRNMVVQNLFDDMRVDTKAHDMFMHDPDMRDTGYDTSTNITNFFTWLKQPSYIQLSEKVQITLRRLDTSGSTKISRGTEGRSMLRRYASNLRVMSFTRRNGPKCYWNSKTGCLHVHVIPVSTLEGRYTAR